MLNGVLLYIILEKCNVLYVKFGKTVKKRNKTRRTLL